MPPIQDLYVGFDDNKSDRRTEEREQVPSPMFNIVSKKLKIVSATVLVLLLATARTSTAQGQSAPHISEIDIVRVDARPEHIINSFDPDSALGSSLDVLSRMDINKIFTPHIIQ